MFPYNIKIGALCKNVNIKITMIKSLVNIVSLHWIIITRTQ